MKPILNKYKAYSNWLKTTPLATSSSRSRPRQLRGDGACAYTMLTNAPAYTCVRTCVQRASTALPTGRFQTFKYPCMRVRTRTRTRQAGSVARHDCKHRTHTWTVATPAMTQVVGKFQTVLNNIASTVTTSLPLPLLLLLLVLLRILPT